MLTTDSRGADTARVGWAGRVWPLWVDGWRHRPSGPFEGGMLRQALTWVQIYPSVWKAWRQTWAQRRLVIEKSRQASGTEGREWEGYPSCKEASGYFRV
jgi:hypothetical protein